jgi:hypothetical protein
VHSIEELAAMARARLGQTQQGAGGAPQPGTPGGAQQGWAAEPQAGPLPGPGGQQSYTPRQTYTPSTDYSSDGGLSGLGDDLAGAALGMAARFIGRAVSRRVQDKVSAAMPAMMAKQETMLRQQIAIAERHPDLCACMTDQVIFLAGGSRTAPFTGATMTMTVEQSDALVAQLRDG